MRPFLRRLREQDAVVCDDPDRVTVDVGEATDQRCTVEFLEFMKFRTVNDACDDLADIVGKPKLARNDAVDILDRQFRVFRLAPDDAGGPRKIQVGDDVARDLQRMLVVVGKMIGNTRDARVDAATAEGLRIDDLPGRRLDQWRTS